MLRHVAIAGFGLVLAAAAAGAQGAANFPDHPIRVIVSVPAGGGVDTVTRIVAAKMSAALGQPLSVENKAGAGGSVAAEAVFNAVARRLHPARLAAGADHHQSVPLQVAQLRSDQLKPVAIMSHVPNVLLVRPDFPAKTVQELIAYAKANPGKLNYASQGIGTTSHLTAELFQTLTHTKLAHVPYKGTAPALNDLIAEPCRSVVQRAGDLGGAAQGRQGANTRGRHQTARRGAPGHSDTGGGRRRGLRIRHLERADRAAEDAGRHRRQAQRRGQQGDEGPRPARSLQAAQLRPGGGTPPR